MLNLYILNIVQLLLLERSCLFFVQKLYTIIDFVIIDLIYGILRQVELLFVLYV